MASLRLRLLLICVESQQPLLEGVVLLLLWLEHCIPSSLKPNIKFVETMTHWRERSPQFDDYAIT